MTSPVQRKSRIFGQYIIKTRFQFKFGIMIFIFLSLAAALIWFEGHFFVKNMIDNGMVTGDDAISQLQNINGIVAKTGILAVAITFGLALFFSHFIAGPIYRFEKTLEQMRDGNLNVHVRLRKNDELQEVAEVFNQTLASLRIKIKKDRDTMTVYLDRALEVAGRLRQAGRNEEAKEIENLVQEAKSVPHQIQI
jgi:methyl-accepting chemotaxis protein